MSDSESAKSVRMEMVEVIKLHMSLEMPEGRHSYKSLLPIYIMFISVSGLHPHRMDLIMVAKVRPVKVPNPTTKKDGRKEVRNKGL